MSLLPNSTHKASKADIHKPSTTTEWRSDPVYAEFPARHLVTGCGVAIFHVKSERVVLCFHSVERWWFLPKGRRDAGEETRRAAEREGFEESGYRNRILPLPIQHRQPQAAAGDAIEFVTEPVWTTLAPNSARTQYLLHWFIAETLPPDIEATIGPPPVSRQYQQPPPYPSDLSLIVRLASEFDGYEPPRYENTGVDSEEALYTSQLLPINEALAKLGRTSQAEVVKIGWERIQARLTAENKAANSNII